jgi:hypothetical protein
MSHQGKTAALVKRLLLCLALVSFGCVLVARYASARRQEAAATAAALRSRAQKPQPQPAFPSANPLFIPPPSIYSGPLFVLSQDYPTQLPTTRPAFLSSDFKADWKGYMMKVRDYCFEGNTDVDFRVEHNKTRGWFHIPWQDYGPQGREGIHGLTKEAQVQKQQLASSQTYVNGQTVAVGFFNDLGGYTIGQVWADHSNPDPSKSSRPNGFPVGTVIFKLLFVDVPPAQVPSLANPKLWQAYVDPCYKAPCNPPAGDDRVLKQVALIQMDIAVRTDDKQAPTGWLFGTFQYNGKLNRPDAWENLVPVGLMWGNDPNVNANTYTQTSFTTPPDKTKINPRLKETVINDDPNELPPTHLGWDGRLNGPVDNPISSCMSCHMTAQFPSDAPLNPSFQSKYAYTYKPKGNAYWMRWFQNIDCTVPFGNYVAGGVPEPGLNTLSTDFSLQLAISITNFCDEYPQTAVCTPTTSEPTEASDKAAKILGTSRPRLRSTRAKPHTVEPIVRDVPEAHPHP